MSVFSIGSSTPDDGFELKSLRFNVDADPKLARTFSCVGDRKAWTLSFWFKLGHIQAPNEGQRWLSLTLMLKAIFNFTVVKFTLVLPPVELS